MIVQECEGYRCKSVKSSLEYPPRAFRLRRVFETMSRVQCVMAMVSGRGRCVECVRVIVRGGLSKTCMDT